MNDKKIHEPTSMTRAAKREQRGGSVFRALVDNKPLGVMALLGVALLTVGIGIGGYVSWMMFGTDVVAAKKQTQSVHDLQEQWKKSPAPATPTIPGDGSGEREVSPGSQGTPFAIMRMPGLGKKWIQPVVQGADVEQLRSGVGHVAGSAMPGQVGNVAIAGHRVTYGKPFYEIDRLGKGDVINIETATANYVYTITGTEIVKPTDVRVFLPVPNKPKATPSKAYLTLSSCHPRWDNKQRYIVYAELISATGKTGSS